MAKEQIAVPGEVAKPWLQGMTEPGAALGPLANLGEDSEALRPHVLVIDDDPQIRQQLYRLYAQTGYGVSALGSAEEGLRRLEDEDVDFVITDIRLPHMDGVQFIARVLQKYPDLPVIAITGYADIQTAVDVLKLGARDFVSKPFDLAAVLESTRAALEASKPAMEIRQLRRWLKERYQFSEMLSQTPQMHRIFELIRLAAPSEVTVLIHGEPGTGKELIAHAIHYRSARRRGPFVALDCAACPESALEQEVFGFAANGNGEAKPGKILAAQGGTLFLDEIDNMPLPLQERMLRVIKERAVPRGGDGENEPVNIRVIAGSSASLKSRVTGGSMSGEFYQRISALPIHLIPLRERSADIPLLIQNYLQDHPLAKSKRIVNVSSKVLADLMEYPWPGNLRELQNVLDRGILLAPGRIIEDVKLPEAHGGFFDERKEIATSVSLRQWLREKEKIFISQKLENTGGHIGLTAKSCRIGVRTLARKMRSYGLNKKRFKEKF